MNILFIFICIFILNIILFFTCYKTTIYSFSKNNKRPTILFISGTHGNEDTGPYCLSNLVHQLKLNNIILKKGRVFIVPNFNKCGLLSNSRYYNKIGKKYDLNRLYGKNFIVNKRIENLVKKSDIIIDLHDAWGYYKRYKGSIGSTIYYHNFKEKNKKELLNLLNKNIKEDFKKFSIIQPKSIRHKNTLKRFVIENYPKKKYILFETTGQNNIQDIHLRTAQCDILVKYILQINNMI